jgi:hypothetical protein
MIPTNDTLTVKKAEGLDGWGRSTATNSLTYKCRIDGSTKLIRNNAGQEVVAKGQILIKGVADIQYTDTLEWSDETGNTYSVKPISVGVLHDFGGKPMFTKVMV